MKTAMRCPACGIALHTDGAGDYICSQRNGCGAEWFANTLAQAETVTVEVPSRFWNDHVGRDLPGGQWRWRTERTTIVTMNYAEFTELFNDAKFYVDMGASEYGVYLVRSAQATLDALTTVVPPGTL